MSDLLQSRTSLMLEKLRQEKIKHPKQFKENITKHTSSTNTPFPRLKKLKKMRLENKVTQTVLANYLGVTTQYYSQIERGINTLSFINAYKLSLYFHVSMEDLFAEDYRNFDDTLTIMNK